MSVSCHIKEYADHGDALLTPEQNRRMFDAVARRYDRLNRILSLGLDARWRQRAAELLAPRPGGRYLDIGCGTGDLCVSLLNRQPKASVTGIDPSEAMLAIARKKCASTHPHAQFEAADACTLPFTTNRFDGIISGFCIRNIVDRAAAFEEMARVTRDGGTIVLLELTRPDNVLLRLGHTFYNRRVVPFVGRVLSQGDAYKYLNDSVAHFPDTDAVAEEMRSHGLRDVHVYPMTGGTVSLFVGHATSVREQEAGR